MCTLSILEQVEEYFILEQKWYHNVLSTQLLSVHCVDLNKLDGIDLI